MSPKQRRTWGPQFVGPGGYVSTVHASNMAEVLVLCAWVNTASKGPLPRIILAVVPLGRGQRREVFPGNDPSGRRERKYIPKTMYA